MSYGIVALINAVSQDVTASLAAAGYPALVDGQILLGRQHQYEQSAPPRIIMTPVKSRFSARASSSVSYLNPPALGGDAGTGVGLRAVLPTGYGSGYTTASVTFTGGGGSGAAATPTIQGGCITGYAMTSAGQGYTSTPTATVTGDGTGATAKVFLLPPAEYQAQSQQKALLTEEILFEVRCWGTIPAPGTSQEPPGDDPDFDFDFTQALYQQVIRSCHHIAVGSFEVIGEGGGVWTDSKVQSSQFFRSGREFVFQLSLSVPILDQLLPYAPVGTAGSLTVQETDPDGSGNVINEVTIAT